MNRLQKTNGLSPARLCMVAVTLVLFSQGVLAQDDDFGVWYSVGAEKKIDKKLSVSAEGEFRTRNDSKTADRWSAGVGGSYKLARGLKLSAGYTFLYDNNKEKINLNDDGSYDTWRPSYWGARHRFNVSLTGSVGLGNLSVSLRERWQYTWRPEQQTDRWDFGASVWETATVRGKGRNVLRSRLQLEYNIPHCKIDPYASVELYNAWALRKTRYTLGADWKIQKKHVLGLFYRYQDVRSDDENEPSSHVLGLSYKFKF